MHSHEGGDAAPIQTHFTEISSSAHRIVEESRGIAEDVSHVLDIKGRIERHPYGTLLAAAGIGYVLGGGLFSPLSMSIFRIGARVALVPLLKAQLVPIAEAAIANSLSTPER